MKISARIKREIGMRPVVGAGYSRRMAAAWYRKTKADYRDYGQIYDKTVLKGVHDRGYLAKSIEKYNLLENKDCAYITDFDYIFLSPFNNSFSKWFDDTLTTGRILKRYNSLNREDVYKRQPLSCGDEVRHTDHAYKFFQGGRISP